MFCQSPPAKAYSLFLKITNFESMLQHIVVWVITRGVITAIALASGKLIRVCAHSQRIHIQSRVQHSANPRSGPDNSWLSCWMAFCFTVLSTTNCLTRDGTPITRWFLCNLWGKFHLKITGQKRMLVEKCMVSVDTIEWKLVQLSHLTMFREMDHYHYCSSHPGSHP